MKTRSLLILTAILLFGVLVTIGLVSQSTSIKKSIKPPLATQSKPPTVNVEKSDSKPAAGEKFDPSEIRQAFSELQALKKGGGSKKQIREKEAALHAAIESGMEKDPLTVFFNTALYLELVKELQEKDESSGVREIRLALSKLQALQKWFGSEHQIKEKKAALKAAIESGIKKDRKSVIHLLFGFREDTGYQCIFSEYEDLFVQSAPDLAIALLDQVREQDLDWVAECIGEAWAKSDLKAALAWANQQTDMKVKDWILEKIITSMAHKNLKGACAYLPLLSPGASEERTIPEAFRMAAYHDFQGALAVMQSLPKGRTKDLATNGISRGMDYKDPQAAMDMASGIGDTGIRTAAELVVVVGLARKDPDAAIQWMRSLPEGQTKDLALKSISQGMYNNPQAAWYLASVIGDEDIRNQAKRYVVWYWFLRDRPAASQWMQSLPVGQTKDFALNYISYQLTMSERQAAFNMASEIGDTGIRTEAMVFAALSWCDYDRAAAIKGMQSLPTGPTKDLAASGISWCMSYKDPQAAMNMASGIADTGIRTEAQKKIVEEWSKKDPAAATQWINSSPLPQEVKTQLLAKAQLLPKPPLPRPIIVQPSRSR
jgi:hypothetical protein